MPIAIPERSAGTIVRQAIRVLVAIGVSEILSQLLRLQDPAWALITAAVVTQTTIGETVSNGQSQILGALIGGAASLIAISLHQLGLPGEAALWSALIPLAALAAWRPQTRLGLVTVLIAMLFPSDNSPFFVPIQRVICVLAGVIVSMVVSFAVLHEQTRRDAFRLAAAMIRGIGSILDGAAHHNIGWHDIQSLDDTCATCLRRIAANVGEARRERWTSLEKRDPMLAALPQALQQLQTDAMVFARAALASPVHDAQDAQTLVRGLVSALEQIARGCDEQAQGRQPADDYTREALAAIPHDDITAAPEWRFILRILRSDMTAFISFLTDTGDKNRNSTSGSPASA
ncbi:FUSC family protein [Acetobacter fallax]|uniref:FUSC family protein n=1 Tax=Acetobacter fallax TaxID=1737473 RepID=A0ABX0KB47_9PROT|nr:FUSC family protein [Acetobacter fallax]NHO32421.1 FUSC family protein [Acetobacter fallax]NHO35911.1 FUSC family protein [Acetobacter fallax]